MSRMAFQDDSSRAYWLSVMLLLVAVSTLFLVDGSSQEMRVRVIPTSGGDAVLVQTPEGRAVLMDTGSDASILRDLGTTLPEWQRSLAAVVLTSPGIAAEGGLPDVLGRYRVPTLLRTPSLGAQTREDAITAAANAQGTKTLPAYRGDRLALAKGAVLDVLWPPQTPNDMKPPHSALVVRLSYGRTSFIFWGSLDERTRSYVERILPPYGAIMLSSLTPTGTYVSDGTRIWKE